jgi:phosphopantetheinyl transferase
MPLFNLHPFNKTTRWGVWHITEPESFFLPQTTAEKPIMHPQKRIQHLAGRHLLLTLCPDFPIQKIVVAATHKPMVNNSSYQFSIAHCQYFAAAILSSTQAVGIDIERITPKIKNIQSKFIGSTEWNIVLQIPMSKVFNELALLTCLWCSKESIFKWYGLGAVDFKQHIVLQDINFGASFSAHHFTASFLFKKNTPLLITVYGYLWEDWIIAWVASE